MALFLTIGADDKAVESESASEVAEMLREKWDSALLRMAISALLPGDELLVDREFSVIRLNNTQVEFK